MRTTHSLASVLLASFSLLVAPACGDDDSPGTPDGPAADGSGWDGRTADGPTMADAPPTPDAPPTIDAFAPDGGPGPDAVPAAIACWGVASPPTATFPLAMAGSLTGIASLGPPTAVAGATVEAWPRGGAARIAFDTTDSTGAFDVTIPGTGVMPAWDGYGKVIATGYITAYIYPPDPLWQDINNLAPVVMNDTIYSAVRTLGGVGMDAPTGGTAFVLVVDCLGNQVEGAVVSFNPPPRRVTYVNDAATPLPDTGLTSTSATGIAIGFDIAAGDTTVMVDYAGMRWQESVVRIYTNEHTLAIIHP